MRSPEIDIAARCAEFAARLRNKSARHESSCLVWHGMTNGKRQPYGRLQLGARFVRAHRAAWIVAFGPIPEGMQVLHRCDNTLCIDPAHLFLGGHAENMADRTEKGRNNPVRGEKWHEAHAGSHPFGAAHYMRRHPESILRGEACAAAKLTTENISAIRSEWASAGSRYGRASSIAARHGIDRTYVWKIVTNRVWRHV